VGSFDLSIGAALPVLDLLMQMRLSRVHLALVVDEYGRTRCVRHVEDLDILDGTPVLDPTPYVPYADAVPEAGAGWLAEDPEPPWEVRFTDTAREQLTWLLGRGVALEERIVRTLALGPQHGLGVARRIRTGTIAVNGGQWFGPDSPFGGYKESGLGRENGSMGIEEFMEVKAVTIGL